MPHSEPRRLDPAEDLRPVLALMRASFAYMEGRIDPPSSLGDLDEARLAEAGEIWICGEGPLACMVLTPKPGTLYLGRFAIAEAARGGGLARRMIEAAAARARELALPSLTLQTRIELVENHARFRALGFTELARTAHPGFLRATSITFQRAV